LYKNKSIGGWQVKPAMMGNKKNWWIAAIVFITNLARWLKISAKFFGFIYKIIQKYFPYFA